ncbi:MAG: hypothetical protein HY372_03485, partial [Candidatus Andersenbacteria bacterium]|nr:hypothetical protein [Candidatus Andersenbacteria bacterium]
MRRYAFLLPAAISAALLVLPTTISAAGYSFQFYNFATSQSSSSFPYGANHEIILVSESANLPELLPIAIVIRVGNDRYKNAIPDNPELACADEHHCSIQGPTIPASRQNEYLAITASTTDGTVLATYNRGTPPAAAPSAAAPATAPASQAAPPSPAAKTAATPAPSPTAAETTEAAAPYPFTAPLPVTYDSPPAVAAKTIPPPATNLLLLLAAGLLTAGAGLYLTTFLNHAVPSDPCAELRALLAINRRHLHEAQQDLDKAREQNEAAQKSDSSYAKREAAKAQHKAEVLVEVITEKIARLEKELAACEHRAAAAKKAAEDAAAAAAAPAKEPDKPPAAAEEACREGEEVFDEA